MSEINLKKLRFENNLSQQDLGDILNVTKQQISKIENGRAKLTQKNYEALKEKFDITCLQDNKVNTEFVELDYYPNSPCFIKDGRVLMSDDKRKYKLPVDFFPWQKDKNYFVCHAVGTSMEPLISDGDFVVLEEKVDNETYLEIEDGTIYLFSYEGKIYLKALSVNINQIVVKSINKDFMVQYINHDDFMSLGLVGKVICHGRICQRCII